MSGGSSIRRRLLVAFMLLAAGLGLTMGMVGLLSYDRLGTHLVDWYARPVMNALIEAEERSRRAEDRGRHNNLVYGADLAGLMDLQFRVGKQIPQEWRTLDPGLHFFDRMENFVFLEEHKGVRYALSGHTGLLVTIKAQLTRVLGLCAGLGLAVAALLAFLLSRRLTGQLTALTRTVSRGSVPRAGDDYPGLPPLPQVALNDEVGVLARAIASREEALRRFVQRESFFTGDVSHELRTPLTVMQGGLEVLELQLERLPGAERCAPTVERLQRTVHDMSATVGVLLLLARRPENIDRARGSGPAGARDGPGAGLLFAGPSRKPGSAGTARPGGYRRQESAGQCPALLGKWPRCRAPGRTCAPGVQCGAHPRGYGHLCPRGACPCPGGRHAGRQRSGPVAGASRLRASGLVGELPAQRRKRDTVRGAFRAGQ